MIRPLRGFAAGLAPEALDRLLRLGQAVGYRPGEPLMRQGERTASPDVFLLTHGHAMVVGSTRDGRQAVLAVRGPGELVGEQAVLDGAARTATVAATTALACRRIGAPAFRRWVLETPGGEQLLARSVGDKLRAATELRVRLAGRGAAAQVAVVLLDLAEHHGSGTMPGPITVAVGIGQRELGAMIGAAPATVARVLTVLRDERLLATGRCRFVVSDLDRLDRRIWDDPADG